MTAATQRRIVSKLTLAISQALGCEAVHLGQRLPDGTAVPAGQVDGRAVSVFGVPAHLVDKARALGLTVEALEAVGGGVR